MSQKTMSEPQSSDSDGGGACVCVLEGKWFGVWLVGRLGPVYIPQPEHDGPLWTKEWM